MRGRRIEPCLVSGMPPLYTIAPPSPGGRGGDEFKEKEGGWTVNSFKGLQWGFNGASEGCLPSKFAPPLGGGRDAAFLRFKGV